VIQRTALSYLLAVVAPAAAVAIILAFLPWLGTSHLFLFMAAVMFVAIFGGLGPAVLSIIISEVASVVFIRAPHHPYSTADLVQLSFFAPLAVAVAVAIAAQERAASEADRLRESNREVRIRLQNIISNVPGVVWEAWGKPDAASQHIDFISDEVERMLGYTNAEWLSVPNFWLGIVHPEDRERAAATATAHFAAGGAGTNQFRWMTKDGRAIWVETHSTVVHDDDGKPIGMRGVTLDISARKRAEESIRFLARVSEVLASSLDYNATLQGVARLAVPFLADFCVVDIVGDDGEMRRVAVAQADPAKADLARRLLEQPPSRNASAGVAAAVRDCKQVVINDIDDAFMNAAAANENHLTLMREMQFRALIVTPMISRGRTLGALTVTSSSREYDEADVEVAELLARRAASAIDNAQLYRGAVDANRAKDEFLATLSHELRTPLTATLGWTRMLSLGLVDESGRQAAIASIERATQSQARLIEDILDVSSIVTGKFRIETGPVDLPRVIEAAVTHAAVAKGIAIHVDTDGWNGVVDGDAARLQQVVWNLLSNAIKFGRRGGTVDVKLTSQDGQARLTVSDDGAGIDAAFLPHVFERFRQADSGANRAHGGLGLGLSIVKHLVELHGGAVHAASDGADRGAKFTIELPLPV
jgi:PAS domain S-box-containing protein